MNLKRAISIDQLTKMKFNTMTFDGAFAESIGDEVERSGSWIIYGDSGHGKTSVSLQFAKYLTRFGRVAYNTIEEGARLSFQKAIQRHKFTSIERRRFIILSEDMPDIIERLSRQKSPDIIIIDSLQFAGITKTEYKKLVRMFRTKLFIWISHSEGKKPLGALAVYVEYNADVKIRVEGFKAIIKTRYGGTEDFVINAERAAEYWNELT